VPFLSTLEVVYDDVLYEWTFTSLYYTTLLVNKDKLYSLSQGNIQGVSFSARSWYTCSAAISISIYFVQACKIKPNKMTVEQDNKVQRIH